MHLGSVEARRDLSPPLWGNVTRRIYVYAIADDRPKKYRSGPTSNRP